MTSVNVTTTKNTVTVNGETRVVTVKTRGPQGPSLPDGDKGDVTVSSNGTAISINSSAVTSGKIADGAIVDADINASAAIALSKLATGALPTAITVTSANISDLSIVNADINASAAIAGTKISPDFGSQNIVTTGTGATGALGVTGDITVSGTVDGRDVATDGTKLDGIETGATADQTAAEILTLIKTVDGAGSGLDADTLDGLTSDSFLRADANDTTVGNLTISNTHPRIFLTDTNNNSDYKIQNQDGTFTIRDETNSAHRLRISSNGVVEVFQQLDAEGGLNVTGNISVSGTVDGRDVATDGTKLDGIEANAINASNTAITNKLPLAGGTVTGNLTVGGNFTVNGTTTTIDTTTLTVEDKNIELGKVSTPTDTTADGGGITLKGATDKTFNWIDATDSWTSSEHIALPDGKKLQLGASQDLELLHDGSDSIIRDVGTGDLRLGGTQRVDIGNADFSKLYFRGTSGGGANLYHNGSVKLGTSSAGINVYGDISVTGTVDGRDLATDGTKLDGIESNATADQTASEIVALVADQTIAPSEIDMEDNEKIKLGTGDDLEIFHDGSNSYLQDSGTGHLIITSSHLQVKNSGNTELIAKFIEDGAVELYYDHQKKFETTSTGGNVTGSLGINTNTPASTIDARADSSATITARNTGTAASISMSVGSSTNQLVSRGVNSSTARDLIFMQGTSTAAKIDTSNNFLIPNDNAKLQIGASQDLEIFHNSNVNTIMSINGQLFIKGDGTNLIGIQSKNGENDALFYPDAQIELFYDGSKKLETTSSGVSVTGRLTATDRIQTQKDGIASLRAGSTNAGGAFLYLDGDSNGDFTGSDYSYVAMDDLGRLRLLSNNPAHSGDILFSVANGSGNTDTAARMYGGGAVLLYFNASKKFETTNSGVTVSGNLLSSTDGNTSISLLDTGHGFSASTLSLSNGGRDLDIKAPKDIRLKPTDGENGIVIESNGQVELYYDNVKKFETKSTGVIVSNQGNNRILDVHHTNGDNAYIAFLDQNTTDNSIVRLGAIANEMTIFSGGSEVLRLTSNRDVNIPTDGKKLQLGASQDLQIYHDGTNSLIKNQTNSLYLLSADTRITNAGVTEHMAKFFENGAVELFYDNSKKFETMSTGVDVHGTLRADEIKLQGDNQILKIGGADDLQLYHSGQNSIINNNVGDLRLESDVIELLNHDSNEFLLRASNGGGVDLYYDNDRKFRTISNGCQVESASGDTFLVVQAEGNDSSTDAVLRLKVTNASATSIVQFGDSDSSSIGQILYEHADDSMRFRTNGSEYWRITSAGHLENNNDTGRIKLGASDDLQIYHTGSFSKIQNSTGDLNLYADTNVGIYNAAGSEIKALFATNGATELYYDNDMHLSTSATGCFTNGSFSFRTDSNTEEILYDQANGKLRFNDNKKANFGSGDDLQIYHDGSNSYIYQDGTGELRTNTATFRVMDRNGGETQLLASENGAVELYHNNSKKFETTSAGATLNGDLTITDDLFLQDNLLMGDGDKIAMGDGEDLQIYHNGSNTFIDNNTGVTFIRGGTHKFRKLSGDEDMLILNPNDAVELYYDNSKKFQTYANGVIVTGTLSADQVGLGDNEKIILGIGDDLQIYSNGTAGYIDHVTTGTGADLILRSKTVIIRNLSNENMLVGNQNAAVELYYDNSKKLETTSAGVLVSAGNLDLSDNQFIRLGASADLRLLHDGTDSYINNVTGKLYIKSSTFVDIRSSGNETMIKAIPNGAVELYYDNSLKLDTRSSGVGISGNLFLGDSDVIYIGSSNDMSLFHDGANSHIYSGTGNLQIRSANNLQLQTHDNEMHIKCIEDGAVELYYDNSKKFETGSDHVSVQGSGNNAGGVSYIKFKSGNASHRANIGKLSSSNGALYIQNLDNDSIHFATSGTNRMSLTDNGHLEPETNGSQNLGNSSQRWANVYTSDLDLSNEANGGNDIDGTWGSYTIQEGAEDLFLINKRSGKKYKFNLTEIS